MFRQLVHSAEPFAAVGTALVTYRRILAAGHATLRFMRDVRQYRRDE